MSWNSDKTSELTEEVKRESMGKKIRDYCKAHKKLLFLASFILIAVIIGGSIFAKSKQGNDAVQEMAFETMTLTKREITNSLSATGTIVSADSKTVTSSLKDIDIVEMSVAVGDSVKAGDIICVFDASDFEEQLEDASTNLNVTQQKTNNEINKAARDLESTKESTDISNSRAVENVSEAESNYNEAKSTLSSAQSAYEKAKEKVSILKTEVAELKAEISEKKEERSTIKDSLKKAEGEESASLQSELTAVDKEITSLQKKYENKQKSYEEAKQTAEEKNKSYEEAKNSSDNASSSYNKAIQEQEDTSRNGTQNIEDKTDNLTNSKLNQVTSGSTEEEQITSLQKQIDSCTIVSPIDGIITNIYVEAGETFEGGEIAVIQDSKEFLVEADIDQYEIPDIEKGQRVVIKTDATEEEELDGEVTFVSPTPDSDSSGSMGSASSSDATYKIQIKLNTVNDRLRIGMTAKASIILEESRDVFAVPYDAISTNANGDSIILVIDNGLDMGSVSGNSGFMQKGEMSKAEIEKLDSEKLENLPDQIDADSLQLAVNQKEIVVTPGLESDYYTEISSDELAEGMQVITGVKSTEMQFPSSDSTPNGGMMFGGMSGGGAPGGGSVPSGGGAPGGGMR